MCAKYMCMATLYISCPCHNPIAARAQVNDFFNLDLDLERNTKVEVDRSQTMCLFSMIDTSDQASLRKVNYSVKKTKYISLVQRL